jgi:penicillin amidase
MSFSRRVYLTILVAISLAAAGAISLAVVFQQTLPPQSGTFALPGLAAPVAVTFDSHGIPFIRAASDTDAAETLGYLHARDRLFQMDLMRRAASGTLSEIFGPIALDNDEEMRRLGLRQSAIGDETVLSPDARALLQAYANGVNAYIAQTGRFSAPEFVLLGRPAPWTITDSLLWGKVLGLWLSGNFRVETARLALSKAQPLAKILALWPADPDFLPETTAALTPADAEAARTALAGLAQFPAPFTQPAQASNEWAVAGSRTASGHPLLAGDPHLAFGFPSLWYLARIDTPDETLAGATAPGTPFLIIGHNKNIAWTFTNTGAAVQDVFIEHASKNGKTYATPTGPQPFLVRTETIKIRGRPDLILKIQVTRHGPVIGKTPDGKSLLAVEMANLAPDDTDSDGLIALNHASSVADAASAVGQITSPVQNLLVADAAHIGFYTTGRVPIRKAGDGTYPVDGADGAHDWLAIVTSEKLPRAIDPPSGELINANNPTIGPDFPVFLSRDTYGDWRARRIFQRLSEPGPETPQNFINLQLDTISVYAQTILPRLLALNLPRNDSAASARALLQNWSGDMTMDRPQPLIFNAWMRAFVSEVLRRNKIDEDDAPVTDDFEISLLGPQATPGALAMWCKGDCTPALHAALETAVDQLTQSYGNDPSAWRWGAAHSALFAHPLLGYLPLIGRFSRFAIPVPGDATTIDVAAPFPTAHDENGYTAVHGPELRAVFDLSNLDSSLFVMAPGESGNLLSPHAGDFLQAWRDGDDITLPPAPNTSSGTLTLFPKSN